MTSVPFIKYQGLGNDFILVDNTGFSEPLLTPEEAQHACNRNFGIGGDGVIFALPKTGDTDYTMRIYNSDGTEPQMCGNGIRCMAKFLQEIEGKSASTDQLVYRIHTNAGLIVPVIEPSGQIRVDMGKPILDPAGVPTSLPATNDGAAVRASVEALGKHYEVTAVGMGNPHGVIFVDDLDTMDPSLEVIGPVMEAHPVFPEKVNAEFTQVLSRRHLKMRVWERGAGPTLACGTGACATLVAGVLTGQSEREAVVSLPGGDLIISWPTAEGSIFMTGPAQEVFRGTIDY
jgi:diaminopimelate epimerase